MITDMSIKHQNNMKGRGKKLKKKIPHDTIACNFCQPLLDENHDWHINSNIESDFIYIYIYIRTCFSIIDWSARACCFLDINKRHTLCNWLFRSRLWSGWWSEWRSITPTTPGGSQRSSVNTILTSSGVSSLTSALSSWVRRTICFTNLFDIISYC